MLKLPLRVMTIAVILFAAPLLAAQEGESTEPEQVLRTEATEFIFVEGSLPLVSGHPSSCASRTPG